jgi:hypothetical protein
MFTCDGIERERVNAAEFIVVCRFYVAIVVIATGLLESAE